MRETGSYSIRQLAPGDWECFRELLTVFGEAFEDQDSYCAAQLGAAYLEDLLGGDSFVALAAQAEGRVVGGLAAYVLKKFEQERSEIYIYDLAVMEGWRRSRSSSASPPRAALT